MDCPINDFTCPYFKNDECTCEDIEQGCNAFYGIEEDYYFDEMGFDPYLGCYTGDC